jgi:hypothetical protein
VILQNLKQSLIDYLNALTIYDYAAFGWLLFLFLIILTLAILLGRKRPTLAISLIMITIVLMFVAPFGIKFFLDKTVRKVEIVTEKISKLHFASSLIISGHVVNDGKVPFKKCRINAKVFKISENKYKNILNNLKPLRNKTIVVDKNISQGESAMFKIVFENFTYAKEYNVSLSGECY